MKTAINKLKSGDHVGMYYTTYMPSSGKVVDNYSRTRGGAQKFLDKQYSKDQMEQTYNYWRCPI